MLEASPLTGARDGREETPVAALPEEPSASQGSARRGETWSCVKCGTSTARRSTFRKWQSACNLQNIDSLMCGKCIRQQGFLPYDALMKHKKQQRGDADRVAAAMVSHRLGYL